MSLSGGGTIESLNSTIDFYFYVKNALEKYLKCSPKFNDSK